MQTIVPTNQQTSIATLTTSSGIRIHNVQTGWVAVKASHRQYSGLEHVRYAAIALDPDWTEWLPINTWVIEHPEGVLLIDSGETARINDPQYTNCDPSTGFVYRHLLRFDVQPQDELIIQLEQINLEQRAVRWLVQTHLHSDHMGSMIHFLNSEVLLSPRDYPSSLGTLPCQYSPNMHPTLVQFQPYPISGFERAHPLTKAGDIFIVPTPGHTDGHQSVILRDGDYSYFFAGDTSFTQAQLLANQIGGIVSSPSQARTTYQHIRAYSREHPTVYLPSHDPESRERLLSQSILMS